MHWILYQESWTRNQSKIVGNRPIKSRNSNDCFDFRVLKSNKEFIDKYRNYTTSISKKYFFLLEKNHVHKKKYPFLLDKEFPHNLKQASRVINRYKW